MSINTDRTFYAAFNRYKSGDEAIVDPSMTRAELVENIRRGELGYDNVVKVLCFNASEGWAIDCTEDVLADVEAEIQRLRDLEDFPLSRLTPKPAFDEIEASLRAAMAE